MSKNKKIKITPLLLPSAFTCISWSRSQQAFPLNSAFIPVVGQSHLQSTSSKRTLPVSLLREIKSVLETETLAHKEILQVVLAIQIHTACDFYTAQGFLCVYSMFQLVGLAQLAIYHSSCKHSIKIWSVLITTKNPSTELQDTGNTVYWIHKSYFPSRIVLVSPLLLSWQGNNLTHSRYSRQHY